MNTTNEYSDIISKINDAQEAVSKEHNKLTKKREELIKDLADVDAKILRLDDIVPPSFKLDKPNIPSGKGYATGGIIKNIQAAANKNIRDQKLIDIAMEIGEKSRLHRFYVVEVAAEADKRGIEMGIAENRYNTVISRLLSRNKKFKLKKSGRFELIK